MVNVLKSDYYKLLRRKSFYICGAISGIIGILAIWLLNSTFENVASLGYNGLVALTRGVGHVSLLTTIFLSILVPSEFAYGTVKNMCSRGVSRFRIYFSKLIIGVFTVFCYTFFTAFCSFVAGSLIWGVGELEDGGLLKIVEFFALFIMAQICLQSVFMMNGFLLRHTGATVALNLGILIAFDEILLPILDYMLIDWFEIKGNVSRYWVGTYVQNLANSTTISYDTAVRAIGVCSFYLVLSTLIGSYVFYKRDVK